MKDNSIISSVIIIILGFAVVFAIGVGFMKNINIAYIIFLLIFALALLIVVAGGLKNPLEFSFSCTLVMVILTFITYNIVVSSIEKNSVKVFAKIAEIKKYKNSIVADVYLSKNNNFDFLKNDNENYSEDYEDTDYEYYEENSYEESNYGESEEITVTEISKENEIKEYNGEKLKTKLSNLKNYSTNSVLECVYNTKNKNLITLEEFNILNMTFMGKMKIMFLNVLSNTGIKQKNMRLENEESSNLKSFLALMFFMVFVFAGIMLLSIGLKEMTRQEAYKVEARVIEIQETRGRANSGSSGRTTTLYTPIYEYEHKGKKYTFQGTTRNFGLPEIGDKETVSLDINAEVFTKESILTYIIAALAFGGMGSLMLLLFLTGVLGNK